jgi:hypothetical protein
MNDVYEIRPRKDHRGFRLLSDALPFGALWYVKIADAIDYAKHNSRARDAVVNIYDAVGKLVEVHNGRFQRAVAAFYNGICSGAAALLCPIYGK